MGHALHSPAPLFVTSKACWKPQFFVQSGETPADAKLSVRQAPVHPSSAMAPAPGVGKGDPLKTQLSAEWLDFDFICCRESVS